MPKHNSRILAIDPGTRDMGIAFLDNRELIYHGVKCIGREEAPHERLKEGRKTVLRLVRDLRPQVLVVEESFFGVSCRSSLLNVFVDEIKAIGKRKGLKVVSYAPTTVRKFICGNGRASKKELSKVVVSKYPDLKVYLTQDRAWKERYHQNMFDAVSLALMASCEETMGLRRKA
jgi:Holliday junction resolvasome RuvABC endonuclease subunit